MCGVIVENSFWLGVLVGVIAAGIVVWITFKSADWRERDRAYDFDVGDEEDESDKRS